MTKSYNVCVSVFSQHSTLRIEVVSSNGTTQWLGVLAHINNDNDECFNLIFSEAGSSQFSSLALKERIQACKLTETELDFHMDYEMRRQKNFLAHAIFDFHSFKWKLKQAICMHIYIESDFLL
jgi:hypothetical protein